MITAFRALRFRPFALLWAGQTVSRLGDSLYQIALAWWVLQETGSALAMGTTLVLAMTPMLLFSLVGGVAVDRFSRVRLMLLSDLGRGAAMAAITVLSFSDSLQIWHVYAASFLFGLADAFFQPAYTAVVPSLTPQDDWTSANSLTSLSHQFGRIAGPPLGALLVGVGGAPFAFAINSASFFVSAAFLLPLLPLDARNPGQSQEKAARPSPLADLREGFAIVLGSPWLWITILLFSITNVTLAGPYSVALPFLVQENWNEDVRILGLLYAAFPVGYVLSGLYLGRLPRLRRRGITAYVAAVVAGLALAVIGLPLSLVILVLAALLNGAALEVFGLIWTNTLQELVPHDKLGRVSSIDALGSYALLPVGFAAAGWAVEQWSASAVLVAGGLSTALLCAAGLAVPAIRRLN